MRQRLAGHQVGCQFSDARGTKLDHHVREVIGQGFDHLLHAFFAPAASAHRTGRPTKTARAPIAIAAATCTPDRIPLSA